MDYQTQDNQTPENRNQADTTPFGWILFLWICGFFIPWGGTWIVIIVSSLLYYAWKDVAPNRARIINSNGWLVFLLSLVFQWIFGPLYWFFI